MKRSAGRCGLSTLTPFLRRAVNSRTVNSKWHAEKEVRNGKSPPPMGAQEKWGLAPEAVLLSNGSQMVNVVDGFLDWG